MRPGAAALIVAALILAGCAGTATRPVDDEKARIDSQVTAAALLAAIGSPQSLRDAARFLGQLGIAGDDRAAGILDFAAGLWNKLLPALDSPFAATAPVSEDAAIAAFPFIADVITALYALDQPAPADEATLAGLDTSLAQVEGVVGASALVPYLRGRMMLLRGQPVRARVLLETSWSRAADFYPAAVALSTLILAGGTVSTELALIEKLAAAMPSAIRFDVLARAYLAAGKPGQAADAAAQGLLIAPDDPHFALLRAEAMDAQGNWYQATRILDALLQLAPDEPVAILEKARIVYERGRNANQAMQILQDARSRYPADPGFPELQGRILLETGRVSAGVAALTRALAIEPARHSTLSLLLRQAVQSGSFNDAASYLDRIPEATRTTADLRLAWMMATGMGDHTRAVDFAREMESRGAAAAGVALEARSLSASGQGQKALAVVDAALPQADAALRSDLYTIRATAGSTDPATDLRRALQANPDNSEALVSLSNLLASQHDFRKAAIYARHAADLAPDNAALAARARDLQAQAGK